MEKQDNGSSKANGGDAVESCKFCGEKLDKENGKQDASSVHLKPSISPCPSLSSSDSCVSSCSDFSVDANPNARAYQDEHAIDSSQEDPNSSLKGPLHDLSVPAQANGIHQSDMELRNNSGEYNTVDENSSIGDSDVKESCAGQEGRDNGVDRSESCMDDGTGTSPCSNEMDAKVWLPPEPEDEEVDREDSVATYDEDDDECGDGTDWGNSSRLSSFGQLGSGSYRYREEKHKAMEEVMNGKFKAFVSQLLKSVGVVSSGKDGQSWVDIVTSVSWEAASFVKPNAVEGKAMDPDGYVKVKCIATGAQSQSQVIKGLVFKKHAAHKHMPTRHQNPRLLLIQGALCLSSTGLSSFDAMKQEKENILKSIIERIDLCSPNVILVEKNVSGDIQKAILDKGITLVFDMKLHRLERVARCTGSPILSSDCLTGQNLKQCDLFYFEKFQEEHAASAEGGKKPSKTLMFLEGCPTRLGCTILLKGTHSDKLKRIKYVVQCAVVMAYHLILETSFLMDQRAMFSTIPLNGAENLSLLDKQSGSFGCNELDASCLAYISAETESTSASDIPITNGFHEEGPQNLCLGSGSFGCNKLDASCHDYISAETESKSATDTPITNGISEAGPQNLYFGSESDSSVFYEPYNPIVLSGLSHLSASLKKVIGDNFPLFSSSHDSRSAYIDLNGGVPNGQIQNGPQLSSSPEAVDNDDTEAMASPGIKKKFNYKLLQSSSDCCKFSLDTKESNGNSEEPMHSKDDISSVLDSESILVLLSSRNAKRGTICEQSHFSHIKFYRNFDVPLGKFLRDNLLNQRIQCNTCGETPEAHYYYYAHHDKQLTIQIRRLPLDNCLRGETEGKLWMWSRCHKCKSHNGSSKSTKRVLISAAARSLSFGKFLELSFSNDSLFSRPSSCGHSFHRDFLYFFGLGPMVAMFSYSPVTTYSVSLPPQKLEFSHSIKRELLKEDVKKVYAKGLQMFLEVERSLKEMKSRFSGLSLNLQGSLREFSHIEEMLKQEITNFEVDIQNILDNGNPDEVVCKLLSLNRVRWELLLESCVWDRRLYLLHSSDFKLTVMINSGGKQEKTSFKEDGTVGQEVKRDKISNEVSIADADVKIKPETPAESTDLPLEIQIEGSSKEAETFNSAIVTLDDANATLGRTNASDSAIDITNVGPSPSVHPHTRDETSPENKLASSGQVDCNRIIPIMVDADGGAGDLDPLQRNDSNFLLSCNVENLKGWIWSPFAEIRLKYMKDLLKEYSLKFESVGSHAPESSIREVIADEGSRLHIPLGICDYIVSDYEDEFSSIIACALAFWKDLFNLTEDPSDGIDTKTYESLNSLTRISSLTSSNWSSTSSLESDGNGIHVSPSILSEEPHLSSFDGLNLLDSLVSLQAIHPEISLGVGKLPGNGKYSVVCLYARQFRDLRNRCCPSEIDYIASLSRCKNWDAKGGKSKSFFAKTLDDRFIIKEIKRTEFDSFIKFAPDYFQHMSQCYDKRNQTCLAKILGIYQVTRQTKSGKETKHDLMVMENLTFGRTIIRQYDLKGALHARFTSAADGSGDVLLDQNFVNDMNASPLYVSMKAKRDMQRAVWNDTSFLNTINVMDYSLLVGVDSQKRELVCGIIDYLRQYTWDKQLENWVKSSLVPKNQTPTVISPKEYKKRFRKFMTTHFLTVPDHWCSQRSSNPCKLCGMEDGSHHSKSAKQEDQDDFSQEKARVQGKQDGFSA